MVMHGIEQQGVFETEAGPVGPGCVIIYGASGDLTRRKLIPALYNLAKDKLLVDEFAIIGASGAELSTESFRAHLEEAICEDFSHSCDREAIDWLMERTSYIPVDFREQYSYQRLQEHLSEVEKKWNCAGNHLHYLAVPPSLIDEIVKRLAKQGLVKKDHQASERVVVEKPFGHDLASARELNSSLLESLHEEQLYRIDHYLGKETVQNLMVLRFANAIFEPVWNHNYVDHVQITVAEQLGVEHRGRYYEEAGALRDMVPNHLMQLMALIAMEPPTSFDAEAVRNKKGEVLNTIQPLSAEDVLTQAVRGQYSEGHVAGIGEVPGYRHEPNVNAYSSMETFVAMKLQLDNWRWADVPFYLRTGKRMPERLTEIAIQFKKVPYMLFRNTPVDHLEPNQLVIRIQPREAIYLRFGAKRPGPSVHIGNVDMEFCYSDYFNEKPTTGYETLLYDAIKGDATLFQRSDSIEAGWSVVEPIIDVWQALPARDFPNYKAGSWGPKAAEELLTRDGRAWRNIL